MWTKRARVGIVGYRCGLCNFNSSTPLVDRQLNWFVFCICICICIYMVTYKHKSKLTTKTLQHRPPPPSSNHPPKADHCSGRFAFNEKGKNSANWYWNRTWKGKFTPNHQKFKRKRFTGCDWARQGSYKGQSRQTTASSATSHGCQVWHEHLVSMPCPSLKRIKKLISTGSCWNPRNRQRIL